jgi:hypothetical protein
MKKSTSICLRLIGATGVLFVGVLGTVWESASHPAVVIDPRLERACHHDVKRKTLHDHRDIETMNYDQKKRHLGILEGQMKSKYQGYGWATITWTCHIHPASGRVIRTEFRKGIKSKGVFS